MTLKSMTGFARSEGRDAEASWHWELRSVNGRGLDMRLRLPPGYEALEPRIRGAISNRLARGSIAVSLNVQRQSVVSTIRVNDAVLSQALAALERICASGDFERPRPDGLLALKGLVEIIERTETPEEAEARNAAMLASLATAVGDVIEARAAEGRRLQAVLAAQLGEIEDLTNRISESPARSPEAIRARLKEQIGRLLDNAQGLDETRLYQEAALLAQRADIDEELKRLKAHVAAARELIAAAGPAGRRLDFIAQELNREANTLCAKSNDVEVTRLGLDLKAVIDQLREQVQNIE
jgi:uncharacterized protein (TIGR00255 family)